MSKSHEKGSTTNPDRLGCRCRIWQAKPLKDEVWNRGKLELASGITLDGELNYNWKAEIVQIRLTDGTVKAYSAFQVNRFVYFDDIHNARRTFVSMVFPIKPALNRPLFLEECEAGPMMVYRRLRHQHEPIRMANPSQFGSDEILYNDLDSFVYYVFNEDSIVELNHFDRDLWPRMKAEFGKQLTLYRSNQHLDVNTTLTKLLLIAQYNALKSVDISASASPEFSTVSPE